MTFWQLCQLLLADTVDLRHDHSIEGTTESEEGTSSDAMSDSMHIRLILLGYECDVHSLKEMNHDRSIRC